MRTRPVTWLRNTLRNRFQRSMLGRLSAGGPPLKRVVVVSATRMDEATFWKTSALGRSLSTWRQDPRVSVRVAFENRAGLPTVYARGIDLAEPGDALLFVHDDIWLDDPKWIDKLFLALRRFDVVGLAGNRRRVPRQPAWLYTDLVGDRFVLDAPHLSGAVAHGKNPRGEVSYFGPSPAACELLDGLFIAARADVLLRSRVGFDPRFQFHFYDLDFCRSARAAGLSVGTWPILVTHQSTGAFVSDGWRTGLETYRAKWRT